jgi:uncharacterized protein
MPYEPPPDLADLSLAQIAELVAARKLPPVDSWNPERTGDSEMRIARDGRWYHQGGEITRPAMVRAFSSLLQCDAEGQHWLVTPQERLSIAVDDAPLLAVAMQVTRSEKGQSLSFRLNSDDLVIADSDHPIMMRSGHDGASPYLLARGRIWAKLVRPVYYELAELALVNGDDGHLVTSNGASFSLAEPA